MELKKFMTMTMATLAFAMGVCSCSNDDDDDNQSVAIAAEVAGQYTGQEIIMVMGEESSNDVKSYQVVKVSETAVDLTVPESGSGMMAIPSFTIKNIPLTKNGKTISGALNSYEGTVVNAQGAEKAYKVSGMTLIVNEKTAVVAFSLMYGNMPMSMETAFTGTKQ